MGSDQSLALGVYIIGVGQAEDVHLDARDDRAHATCWRLPGVVCRAIALQTVSISWAMPRVLRKSRAALAPSTSKRAVQIGMEMRHDRSGPALVPFMAKRLPDPPGDTRELGQDSIR